MTTPRSASVDHRSSTPANSRTMRMTPTRAPTPMASELHDTRRISASSGASTPVAAAPASRSSPSRCFCLCSASRLWRSMAAGCSSGRVRARRSAGMVRSAPATARSAPTINATATSASVRSASSRSSGAPDDACCSPWSATVASPATTIEVALSAPWAMRTSRRRSRVANNESIVASSTSSALISARTRPAGGRVTSTASSVSSLTPAMTTSAVATPAWAVSSVR